MYEVYERYMGEGILEVDNPILYLYRFRAYNSHEELRKNDHKVLVKLFGSLCVCFSGFPAGTKFVDETPHFQLNQVANKNRCAVHVLCRAWQLATNQLQLPLNAGAFHAIEIHLLYTSYLPHMYLTCTSCIPHNYLQCTSHVPPVYLIITSHVPHMYLLYTS